MLLHALAHGHLLRKGDGDVTLNENVSGRAARSKRYCVALEVRWQGFMRLGTVTNGTRPNASWSTVRGTVAYGSSGLCLNLAAWTVTHRELQ